MDALLDSGSVDVIPKVFLCIFVVSSEAHIEVVCCHDILSIFEKSWQKG
jgi:hypothetical protein